MTTTVFSWTSYSSHQKQQYEMSGVENMGVLEISAATVACPPFHADRTASSAGM